MQNRPKDRKTQKQNEQFPSFQIKTKQYNNLTAANSITNTDDFSYSPKQTPKNQHHDYSASNRADKAQNISFKQRYNLEDHTPNPSPFSLYNQKSSYQRSEVGKIARNNLEVDYRKYLKDTTLKTPITMDTLQSSLEVNSKLVSISHSQSFKKQNAKKKGLQMKMTNIDTISDQITSLLSMVNKGKRITDTSISESANKYDERDYIRDVEGSLEKYQARNQKSPIRNIPPESDNRYLNRQKRDRAYSELTNDFRLEFDSKKFESKKYESKKYGVCNQEDNRWMDQLKPTTNNKYLAANGYHDNHKYLQNRSLERSTSPYKREHIKSSQKKQKQPDRQYEQAISPYKNSKQRQQDNSLYERTSKKNNLNFQRGQPLYNEKQERKERQNPKYAQYTPKYLKSRQKPQGFNELLPLSIQKRSSDKRESSFERQDSFERQEMKIQQHLKKLKGKVLQSQQKNNRYHEKLKDRQYELITHEEKPADRLYKKNEQRSQFELKLYPVQIDKPNCLRVAEKMAEQIQIDQKLTLPRIQLQKEQDQYKWSQIELTLKSKELKMTRYQIQTLLELSQEQMNSISYPIKSGNSRKNIGDLLFQAQKHWQKQVYGCASMKGLKMQNFNPQSLNLHKGCISLQDLTDFVNMYTGRQYSSQDLLMIYRRLQLLQGSKHNERVQFGTFLRTISI